MPRVSYKKRRAFAADLLEHAFFGAFYTAIVARKNEDGLTRAQLGSRMGREKTGISKLLSGPRNWQLSTISDLSEALNLKLEFRLIDRLNPFREFTSTGVQYPAINTQIVPPMWAQNAYRQNELNIIPLNTSSLQTYNLQIALRPAEQGINFFGTNALVSPQYSWLKGVASVSDPFGGFRLQPQRQIPFHSDDFAAAPSTPALESRVSAA
jgi:hypothetical protein